MGHLLSQHLKERNLKDVFVDFENSKPSSDDELGIALQLQLDRIPSIMSKISEYKGCGAAIREAMSKPGPETEGPAWEQVLPCVIELKSFYDFAISLETHLPKLLSSLSSDPKSSLTQQQSQAKQLADVIDFTLRFDEKKMGLPSIQNDYAFYRRVSSRHPNEQVVSDDDSYKMSMFYAHSSPMMKTVSAAVLAVCRKSEGEKVQEILASMANVCYSMVDQKRFASDDTNAYCCRVMTGSIMMFDSVHPLGVFCKKSPVLIKKCLGLLKSQVPVPEMLLNSIKFNCPHLNDEDTPQSIKALLE